MSIEMFLTVLLLWLGVGFISGLYRISDKDFVEKSEEKWKASGLGIFLAHPKKTKRFMVISMTLLGFAGFILVIKNMDWKIK